MRIFGSGLTKEFGFECGWLADTCHCLTVGWGDPIRARSFNNTLFHQSWSRVKDGDKFCAWVKVITLKVSQLLARVCVHLLKIIWLTSTVPLAPSLISRPFCLSVIILLDFGGWQGCHLYILFRFQYINAILEYLGPFFSPKSNSTSLSYMGGHVFLLNQMMFRCSPPNPFFCGWHGCRHTRSILLTACSTRQEDLQPCMIL